MPSIDSRSRRVALGLTAAALVLVEGTAAAQPAEGPAPSAQPDATAPPTAADVAALRAEVQALRADLEKQREATPAAPLISLPQPAATRPLGYEQYWPWVLPPEGLSLRGYLQSQYESHQDSQD